jgi:hypothetical protein
VMRKQAEKKEWKIYTHALNNCITSLFKNNLYIIQIGNHWLNLSRVCTSVFFSSGSFGSTLILMSPSTSNAIFWPFVLLLMKVYVIFFDRGNGWVIWSLILSSTR